jgi:hypothetical protein
MLNANPYESSNTEKNELRISNASRETSAGSWAALIAPLLIQMLLACACGHLHLYLLPVTLALLVSAIHAYSRPQSRTLLGLIAVAAAMLFFGKHVGDILWLGHDPLFSFSW